MGKHAELRDQLTEQLKTVRERLERIEKDRRREANALSPDFEEQATIRENDEVLDRLDEQLTEQSQALAEAIARIDDGSYGICRTCQSEIAPARLEALPRAAECIECASKRTA